VVSHIEEYCFKEMLSNGLLVNLVMKVVQKVFSKLFNSSSLPDSFPSEDCN
jgi:hypothetical protein